MHVVVAPDAFSGSLSAADVASHLARGIHAVRSDLDVRQIPVADGGEGTVDAAVAAGYERVAVVASGPIGDPVGTSYARCDRTAIVELASVCGRPRLPSGRLEPMRASSAGFGEIIGSAIRAGCERIVLAVGGSASTDGGAGMVQALGARIGNDHGEAIPPGGGFLKTASTLDVKRLRATIAGRQFVLARDVDNPLTGPRGAATVYGPQKGATPEDVATLEAALQSWATLVGRTTGRDRAGDPGAGAAGGVGFAAMALLEASSRPGIDVALEFVGLSQQLVDCCLVITGEGSLDEQTLAGKAPAGVAAAARRAGVATVAVAGRVALHRDALRAGGFAAAYELLNLEPDEHQSMRYPARLLERIGGQIAADWL